MQIFQFFWNLDMLRKGEYVDLSIYPQYSFRDILFYEYSETLRNDQPVCLLYYCTMDAPLDVKTVDITGPYNYMKTLDAEPIDIENAISPEDLRVLLLEASRLYDGLDYSGTRSKLVDMVPMGSTGAIHALCTGTDYDGELSMVFDGNIFLRDLLFSQVRYFAKMYVKNAPEYNADKEVTPTLEQFDDIFRKTFAEYYENHGAQKRSNLEITGRPNKALDDIMEQLLAGA